MWTSRAFWLPSACGMAALPRKVPSLMSAIEAFTTATIIAFSVSVSLSSAPSLDFKVSTLPSTLSIVPRTRTVCAVAAAHDAAAHSIRQDGPIRGGEKGQKAQEQLAALRQICLIPCEEYEDLEKAIT